MIKKVTPADLYTAVYTVSGESKDLTDRYLVDLASRIEDDPDLEVDSIEDDFRGFVTKKENISENVAKEAVKRALNVILISGFIGVMGGSIAGHASAYKKASEYNKQAQEIFSKHIKAGESFPSREDLIDADRLHRKADSIIEDGDVKGIIPGFLVTSLTFLIIALLKEPKREEWQNTINAYSKENPERSKVINSISAVAIEMAKSIKGTPTYEEVEELVREKARLAAIETEKLRKEEEELKKRAEEARRKQEEYDDNLRNAVRKLDIKNIKDVLRSHKDDSVGGLTSLRVLQGVWSKYVDSAENEGYWVEGALTSMLNDSLVDFTKPFDNTEELFDILGSYKEDLLSGNISEKEYKDILSLIESVEDDWLNSSENLSSFKSALKGYMRISLNDMNQRGELPTEDHGGLEYVAYSLGRLSNNLSVKDSPYSLLKSVAIWTDKTFAPLIDYRDEMRSFMLKLKVSFITKFKNKNTDSLEEVLNAPETISGTFKIDGEEVPFNVPFNKASDSGLTILDTFDQASLLDDIKIKGGKKMNKFDGLKNKKKGIWQDHREALRETFPDLLQYITKKDLDTNKKLSDDQITSLEDNYQGSDMKTLYGEHLEELKDMGVNTDGIENTLKGLFDLSVLQFISFAKNKGILSKDASALWKKFLLSYFRDGEVLRSELESPKASEGPGIYIFTVVTDSNETPVYVGKTKDFSNTGYSSGEKDISSTVKGTKETRVYINNMISKFIKDNPDSEVKWYNLPISFEEGSEALSDLSNAGIEMISSGKGKKTYLDYFESILMKKYGTHENGWNRDADMVDLITLN